MYRTRSKKFATLRVANISSFEAIRDEMDKNIEDDEFLNYSGETLERQQNFRTVLLAALLA